MKRNKQNNEQSRVRRLEVGRSPNRTASLGIASAALAFAILGCHPDENRDDAPVSAEVQSENVEDHDRDTPAYLATGVRPGLSNPWASNTRYPDSITAVVLDPEQRAMIEEYNWRTGKRFKAREVARLVYLHRELPGNSTLMPFDPDSRARQAALHEENRALAYKIDSGDASDAQISNYYDFKERHYVDRIELIDFVLSEPFWDTGTLRRYQRSRETAEGELAKTQALHRYALREQAQRPGEG